MCWDEPKLSLMKQNIHERGCQTLLIKWSTHVNGDKKHLAPNDTLTADVPIFWQTLEEEYIFYVIHKWTCFKFFHYLLFCKMVEIKWIFLKLILISLFNINHYINNRWNGYINYNTWEKLKNVKRKKSSSIMQ